MKTGPVNATPAAAARRWGPPLGLALLCVAAYANSFDAGFVLDSRQLVLQDTRVHALTRENLSLIVGHSYWWPYGESGLYRPLTTLSYLFNYSVLGNADRPAGYHGFNLLLHIANVLMLWRLTLRLTGCAWTGAAAAAIWAVLPLSTEAVTNIVGRADLMAASGSLAAVLLYLRARDGSGLAPSDPGRRGPGAALGRRHLWTAGVALAITAGVLSKESALAALGLLVMCEVAGWTAGRSLSTLAPTIAACAVPLGAWLAQRAAVLGGSAAAEFPFTDNPIVDSTFLQGRLTAVQVMWRYLALIAWPRHLSNDYSYTQIPLANGVLSEWLACLLFMGGAMALLWRARAQRAVLFFAAFAFITFLPASNLLFATGTIMGERLAYLPSAGLAALAAMGLRLLGTTGRRRWAASALAALIIAGYGFRTHARNPDWTSDVTLWRSAVAAAPASASAHRALAAALYDLDPTHTNIDEVIREAETSVALLERLEDARNTFQAFRQTGAYYLDKANRVEGDPLSEPSAGQRRLYARALTLLDRALLIARAGATRIRGASKEPEADAQRLRAAALLGLEDAPLALQAANRSRALSPLHPLAYRLAAAALLALDRPEEAVMTLLAGSTVSGERGLLQEAMKLYRNGGLDTEGCALTGSDPTAVLNLRCPAVLRHSCLALAAASGILENAGLADRAVQTKTAVSTYLGCPEDALKQARSLVP